jgi:hypothetical protein
LLKGSGGEGSLYQFQQRIVQRAEGNPFYIEEIVRMLIEQQILVRHNGRFEPTTRPEVASSTHGSLIPSLTVASGLVYISTDRGYVAAFGPDGKRKWNIILAAAAPFHQPLRVHSDGSLYLAGEDNGIYGLDAQGNVKFRFQTNNAMAAAPTLAADGSVYAATLGGTLYALNGDGSLRFQSTPAQSNSALAVVLAPDAKTIYGLAQEGQLLALNASSGALLWHYDIGAEVLASPTVEGDGALHIIDVNGAYRILNEFGAVITTFDLGISGGQKPILGINPRRNIYIPTGQGMHIFTRLPIQWDGRPDLEATADDKVWKLANPMVTDIGADLLHTPQLPNRAAVTGKGITVAVLVSACNLMRLFIGRSLRRSPIDSWARLISSRRSAALAVAFNIRGTASSMPATARIAMDMAPMWPGSSGIVSPIMQQGMGRIWASTAVFGGFPSSDFANQGMNIETDLAYGWQTGEDLAYQYQGPIRRMVSDDGATNLYYAEDANANTVWGLGAVQVDDKTWVDWQTLAEGMATWAGGQRLTSSGISWAGGLTQPAGMATWAVGMATWAGGINVEESVLAGTSWVNDDGSTALLQSHTVFNDAPQNLDVQPAPNTDTGIQRIFIPAVSR